MEKTYVIAEMACSHEGDPELARKIIDGAGMAGADAVQFQIWSLRDMVVPQHPDYGKLQKIELSRSAWRDLAAYARGRYPELHIIACVYERSSIDFAEDIRVDAYKIHSSDLSNPYLLKYAAQTGRRIDLSVGASTLDEIQNAIQVLKDMKNGNLWLMYGYQNFPTPFSKINLRVMLKLKELFELPVGYQDHSDAEREEAFWVPAAAIGLGADVVEKHITHDRSRKGIDHESALNPDEFSNFVRMVRIINEAQGSSVPVPFSAEEARYRTVSKKSIVSSRQLRSGTVIGEEDVLFMRAAATGLPPDRADRLVGRTLKHDIGPYELIMEKDIV